jgi:hypothetical protein
MSLAQHTVIENHGDASCCYIQDMLLTRDKDVTPYHLSARWSYVRAPEGTCPRFLVVDTKCREISSFLIQKCVRVVDLVLADGEGTLFSAVTSLTQSNLVGSIPFERGMTLIVKDKEVIVLDDHPSANPRALMIINKMAVRFPPHYDDNNPPAVPAKTLELLSQCEKDNYTDDVSLASPVVDVHCFPNATVESVRRNHRIHFMSVDDELPEEMRERRCSFPSQPIVYKEAPTSMINDGKWGLDRGDAFSCAWRDFVENESQDWYENKERIQLRNENVEPCLCKTRFGLRACCAFFVPPEIIPTDELFAVAKEHGHTALLKESHSNCFQSISHASQQALLSWWYMTNFFSMFPTCRTLPNCVVSRIVCRYPSPSDEHILWMVTQQAGLGKSLLAKCIQDSIRMETEDDTTSGTKKRKALCAVATKDAAELN